MISFPNAKINLGLNIISKRDDGFHNLESLFQPIRWSDILEIIPSPTTGFSSSGIAIPGNTSENLCIKAYDLLKTKYSLPAIQIHLNKIIPIGAGLGGGSADAAFMLKSLNVQFELNLSDKELLSFARKLGSDCAFFIFNKPLIAYEKGDVFEEIDPILKGKYIIVIHPGIHVSTAEAYAGVTPGKPDRSIKEILASPIQCWKEHLKNDFEYSIFKKYPEIEFIKTKLYEENALYASMSGSGSAVYGIFDEETEISAHFPNYTIWQGRL